MRNSKSLLKMITLSMLIALGVVISPILRVEGMCPMAHFINIVCSVFMGPWYSLLCATLIGIIRMITMGIPPIALTGAIFGAFLSGKIVFPCSRVLLCPNSPCLSMVLVCGQNFCCGQYVVVMWSATPSDFCSQCESGGVCIVALAAAVVKRFRR